MIAPLRFYFSLLHSGYLRNYAAAIELLCSRGHHVHAALVRDEKHPGDDALLAHLTAGWPTFTFGPAPAHEGLVPRLERVAATARTLQDVARYAHPDYAHADALRTRAIARAEPGRVGRRLLPRLARTTSSRRVARRLAVLRAVDASIRANRETVAELRELAPDVVLATPVVEYGSAQVEYLKAARSLGLPVGVCVASWDNLTNKGLVRFVPDRLFVWNELQADEAVRYHGIPRARVAVTGAARFDPWFARRPATTPDTFAQRVGLHGTGHLLYLCSSGFIAPDELSFVRRWLGALRASGDERLPAAPVLVRPHPHNARQWRDADLSEYGDVVVHPRVGTHPDAGDAAAVFFDSIAHSAAVVGINTSALIESAIAGKSVFTVLDPQFRGSQEGTLHFHYLRADRGGFVHEAESLEEHARQLAAALRDPAAESRRVQEFIHRFVRPAGLDVPAATVMADAFESLGANRRR